MVTSAKIQKSQKSEYYVMPVTADNCRDGVALFVLGFLGLVVMSILTLIAVSDVANVPIGGCSMAGFAILWTMALPASPFYLMLAIICFVGSFSASVLYKGSLRLMAALDIIGLIFMTLVPPFLCNTMIVAWLIYYVPVFAWLIYCAVRAHRITVWLEESAKVRTKNTEKK